MNKKLPFTMLAVFLSFILLSCASSQDISNIPEGKASIYIKRPNGLNHELDINDIPIGVIAPKDCIRIDVDPGYYTLNYYIISFPNMRSELAPNFTKRYRLNAGDKRFILVHGMTNSITDVSGKKGFKELTSVIDFAPMLKKREYEDSVKRAIMQQSLQIARLPQNEPTTQVEGLGTTALEQTIVRWEIQSRPLGADIFWRVVSKTPDVKSTNNKYLTTTPYEATKTLDIKGLTYQTAGNVRIILRCEKEGYYAQEKEFDVRTVLDQEEISAFFRLVKEETN